MELRPQRLQLRGRPSLPKLPYPGGDGNWQVARSKKTGKKPSVVNGCPPRCASTSTGDHTACQSLVSRGRYHAISEAHYDPYLGGYDSSDLDFDIPMLMVNVSKAGDVPLNTVRSPQQILEGYRNTHKEAIKKKSRNSDSPATHVRKLRSPFPLNPEAKPEEKLPSTPPGLKAPQHYVLSTPPPSSSTGAVHGADEGAEKPLSPLPALGFPLPDHKPLSRKDERTIAQRNQDNIANAIDNARFLGLHLLGVKLQEKPVVIS